MRFRTKLLFEEKLQKLIYKALLSLSVSGIYRKTDNTLKIFLFAC